MGSVVIRCLWCGAKIKAGRFCTYICQRDWEEANK
jgi:hypothetical protein